MSESPWRVEVLKPADLDELPFSRNLLPFLERTGCVDQVRRDLLRITTDGVTIHRENVMAAVGVVDLWPRCGEVWLFLSPNRTPQQFVVLHRILQGLLTTVMQGYRRLQAHVPVAGNTVMVCWMQHLGFHIEGTLKRFGPDGSDYFILGRT